MGTVQITIAQPIFFILKKIILIINNLVRDETFFKDIENYKPTRFFLDIGGDIVCLIGFLIYLEIIELNCFNLNYNLRKNIILRGRENYPTLELNSIMTPSDEDNNSQDTFYFDGLKLSRI